MGGVDRHCPLISCHQVSWVALCIRHSLSGYVHHEQNQANTKRSLASFPFQLMHSQSLSWGVWICTSAINHPNSIGQIPQKKLPLLGLGNLVILWKWNKLSDQAGQCNWHSLHYITKSWFVHSNVVINNLVISPRCIEAQNNDLCFHRHTVTPLSSLLKLWPDKVCNVLNTSTSQT